MKEEINLKAILTKEEFTAFFIFQSRPGVKFNRDDLINAYVKIKAAIQALRGSK